MNTNKLYKGQTFKNYKAMCKELEMDIKNSTDSKKGQFKELERFAKYSKSGHRIIIDEVYENPLPKIENRGGNNNTIYGDVVQLLIADLLARCDGHVSISSSKLMRTLGMTNTNYSDCRELVGKLSKYTEIDEKTIYDFYNISGGNFCGIIERALNSLMDKRVIMYNKVIKVKEKNKFIYRNATDTELEIIMEIEKELLEEFGYKEISRIRNSKDWRKFRIKSKRLISEQSDIEFYYTAYDITVNGKYIVEECNELIDLLLEHAKRIDSRNELNKLIITNLIANAQKRNEKGFTFGKKVKVRMSEDYVNNFEQLADLLIHINTPNIIHELRKIKTNVDEWLDVSDDIDDLFC